MNIKNKPGLQWGILLAACLTMLTGCAGAGPGSTITAADALSVSDAWVKAADTGMTGGFGTLHNDSDEAVTVLAASSDVSTAMELHETVTTDAGGMVMQAKDGGFAIPPHGEFVLEPGGNHIMFMDLAAPLVPGDEVRVTLTLSDDSTYEFSAPVKEFSGANENYVGGGSPTPSMGGMSH